MSRYDECEQANRLAEALARAEAQLQDTMRWRGMYEISKRRVLALDGRVEVADARVADLEAALSAIVDAIISDDMPAPWPGCLVEPMAVACAALLTPTTTRAPASAASEAPGGTSGAEAAEKPLAGLSGGRG